MRSLKTIKDAVHLFTFNNYHDSGNPMRRLSEKVEWAFQNK